MLEAQELDLPDELHGDLPHPSLSAAEHAGDAPLIVTPRSGALAAEAGAIQP
jgi:hypothetical protein